MTVFSRFAGSTILVLAQVVTAACTDSHRTVAPEETSVAATPAYTAGSGTVSALIARSSLVDGFKVKRKTGIWEVDIHAKDPTDLVVATLTIQPGGDSGWHTHPGPGFVQVTSGTAHFYEATHTACSPTIVTAGQAWLDRGELPHVARNEGDAPLTLLVTLMLPPGAPPRIDEPSPGNCGF